MRRSAARPNAVLVAAKAALLSGVTALVRQEESASFKRALLRMVERRIVSARPAAPTPKTRAQTPRKVAPSGRVQAARHDSPRGRRAR